MAEQPEDVTIAYADDPDAPVIFADELTGGGPLQGNFNFTFAVVQYDHSVNPPKAYRKACLRLIMPSAAARAAYLFLKQHMEPEPAPTAGPPNPKLN